MVATVALLDPRLSLSAAWSRLFVRYRTSVSLGLRRATRPRERRSAAETSLSWENVSFFTIASTSRRASECFGSITATRQTPTFVLYSRSRRHHVTAMETQVRVEECRQTGITRSKFHCHHVGEVLFEGISICTLIVVAGHP
jgi:hypothetical protein